MTLCLALLKICFGLSLKSQEDHNMRLPEPVACQLVLCHLLSALIVGEVHQWNPCILNNDSTSPAMDQSGLEPSSLVQVQSKKSLDRDRTNPQFFGTGTELAWTALDQSTRAESARILWELLIH